jgi:hypothetical protein
MRWILAVLVVAGINVAAWADDTEPPVTFHKGQFGLSARLGLGIRGIATYHNDIYCGKTDMMAARGFASVCTSRMPIALDLEAAYGVAKSIELTLELRIGIESDFGSTPNTDGPRPLRLAPGARFFFSEAKRTKLFVQPAFVIDFADYAQRPGNDYGVRGIEGFWIDLHRSYGLYVYIAETLEFAHWLSAAFEGGIGFQGRYP